MIALQHIHPMIVHFPIVLLILLVCLDAVLVARGVPVTGRAPYANISVAMVVLAAVSAMVAVYFGGIALDFAEAGGFESDVAEIHELLGTYLSYVLVAWAALRGFLWFRDIKLGPALAWSIPVIELIGAAFVVVVAYYGGELVFALGVNVVHPAG